MVWYPVCDAEGCQSYEEFQMHHQDRPEYFRDLCQMFHIRFWNLKMSFAQNLSVIHEQSVATSSD